MTCLGANYPAIILHPRDPIFDLVLTIIRREEVGKKFSDIF